jgi:predicted PurR-regulated permease PerM
MEKRISSAAKISDVRGAGKGGAVERLQETIDAVRTGLEKTETSKGKPAPRVFVTSAVASDFPAYAWLSPMMGSLGTAGLVVALVIFMLLERRELRDRLLGLFGHGQLTVTTKAFDEAGSRVSRQLLMQSLVSCIYGVVAGVGLYLLGVPYAFVWGALGAALRYIPYVGPVVAAGAPIIVSLAALPGWTASLWVVAFFVVLELLTKSCSRRSCTRVLRGSRK